MTLKIRIILLFFAAIMLAGCNSTGILAKGDSSANTEQESSDVDLALSTDDSASDQAEEAFDPDDYPVEPFPGDSLYELLVAEVAGYRGEYDMALQKYLAMAEETHDPGVAARATRLATYLKRSDDALKAAKIWAEAEPDNLDAHRHAAELMMRSGDIEGAFLQMEAVKNLGGSANFDIFAYRAENLTSEEREAILVAVDRMLLRYPDDVQLIFSKAVLLEQKGEAEGALALANQLLKTQQNINTIILKVNALKSLDRSDEAIDFLSNHIKTIAKTGAITQQDSLKRLRLIYARFLFEAGQLDLAREQYEIVLKLVPNDGDVLFALALIAMEQKQFDTARGYFQQMVRWNRRVGEARYYLGSLAEKEGNADLAIKEYKQVGNGYEFLPAQSRIASLLVTQGRIEEMQQYMAEMQGKQPGRQTQLIMIEGQVFVDHGMQTEAFSLLDEALANDVDNADLLYFRAMTGEKFNRLDILERDLSRIIEMDPNNADALNALGYTLTDQTDRHDEALALIKRALAIKPDEAAFIDSLGWANYRLKNYDEAIVNLRRALKLFPNDEVAAHLGEVLWVSGNKAEASKVWDAALAKTPESVVLKKVIEKFTSQ